MFGKKKDTGAAPANEVVNKVIYKGGPRNYPRRRPVRSGLPSPRMPSCSGRRSAARSSGTS